MRTWGVLSQEEQATTVQPLYDRFFSALDRLKQYVARQGYIVKTYHKPEDCDRLARVNARQAERFLSALEKLGWTIKSAEDKALIEKWSPTATFRSRRRP